MKETKVLIIICTIMLIFVLLGFGVLLTGQAKINQEYRDIRETCFRMGFPEMIEINETIFCLRQVDGTDEIIPLDWAQLHGGE